MHRFLFSAVLLTLSSLMPLAAQFPHFGLKIGTRFNDSISADSSYRPQDRHLTGGPALEIGLPGPLAIGAEALFKWSGYESSVTDSLGGTTYSRARQLSVDIPLMAKLYMPGIPFFRPFATAGIAGRYRYGGELFRLVQPRDINGRPLPEYSERSDPRAEWDRGYTFGGGVQFRPLFFRVSGELRYTRWTNLDVSEGSRGAFFGLNRNQVEFLIGFGF